MNQELFFETIRCEDYEVFHLEYHKARIANTIGKNFDLQEYIYPPNKEFIKCKLIYNQDEIVKIQYDNYTPKQTNSFKLVNGNNIDYNKKYLDRSMLDQLQNLKENSDDIIIIKNDLLTDTSIANIALYIDNRWVTPKSPLLHGTTRARLLEEGVLFERDLSIKDLKKATSFAIMNAMIGFKSIVNYKINY